MRDAKRSLKLQICLAVCVETVLFVYIAVCCFHARYHEALQLVAFAAVVTVGTWAAVRIERALGTSTGSAAFLRTHALTFVLAGTLLLLLAPVIFAVGLKLYLFSG